MTREYAIGWVEKKDRLQMKRTTWITLSKPTGKVEYDARQALNLFIRNFGGLKKNDVLYIKEFDENGQIGEDIVPTSDENAIIPTMPRQK